MFLTYYRLNKTVGSCSTRGSSLSENDGYVTSSNTACTRSRSSFCKTRSASSFFPIIMISRILSSKHSALLFFLSITKPPGRSACCSVLVMITQPSSESSFCSVGAFTAVAITADEQCSRKDLSGARGLREEETRVATGVSGHMDLRVFTMEDVNANIAGLVPC